MRDFRATRTQRLISEIRFTLPDLIAGLALFAFVLFVIPILAAAL